MSENDDTKPESQTLTFEPLGYLANESSQDDVDERQPVKNYANELITNIIKDASQQASKNQVDNFDNTNELNFSETSKQNQSEDASNNLEKTEYSTTNGIHNDNDNDFDNEDIQNKMNGVIQDIQSHPQRQSISSNHLTDEQISTSAPINTDSSSNNHLSEDPALIDQNLTGDADEQRPASALKQNGLDDTTRFGASTPPRAQSAASKRSVQATPDETSTSGDEKHVEPTNEIEIANQEVNNIVRRPSRALSPLDRPRSPTPNDSQKTSTDNEIPTSSVPEQSLVSADEHVEVPTTVVLPASRRESASQNDEQEKSRPTSAFRTNADENPLDHSLSRTSSTRTFQFVPTADQSKLIIPGESLQIPIDELEIERVNSPPPSKTGIQSLTAFNPLIETEQSRSPEPSEKHRKSPSTSMLSTEKTIDGDVVSTRSRAHSNVSQQQQQLNNIDPKPSSRPGSQTLEQTSQQQQQQQQQDDESTQQSEQLVRSRRSSKLSQDQTQQQENILPTQQSSSRSNSFSIEQKPSSPHEASFSERKTHSRNPSNVSNQQVPSKRASVAEEQQPPSRKESTASERPTTSKRTSFTSEHQVPVDDQQKTASRNNSFSIEQKLPTPHETSFSDRKTHSRNPSNVSNQQVPSKRPSLTSEHEAPAHDQQKTHSRNPSNVSNQQVPSKRPSFTSEHEAPIHDQQKTHSRNPSNVSNQQVPSKRASFTSEHEASVHEQQKTHSRNPSNVSNQQVPSKRASFTSEHEVLVQPKSPSRKGSSSSNQQVLSRRDSPAPEQQFDQQEQKSSSKPGSRKTSFVDKQDDASRRSSANQDRQPSGSRSLSNNAPRTASQQSSRHNSATKQEQQPYPTANNNDSRRSSANRNDTNEQNVSHRERTPSYKKQQPKSNSHFDTDETVVTPIIMDSSKTRQQNGKRSANAADTSFTRDSSSKLPPVNSSYSHEKQRSADSVLNKSISTFNRAENKPLSSSHIATTTTTSEDEQPKHWTAKVIVPSIHLTDDDDDLTPREDQPRPQSPNAEQIAERNPALTPPLVTTTTAAAAATVKSPDVKKQNIEKSGERKRKDKRLSRRSTSTESLTHIPLVDDKSLDSASDNNTDLERQQQRRRQIKPKKKDVETNTDQAYDSSQQEHSFFDDKELSSKKPLKATKPLSEYVQPTRRRAPNKEIALTTPDTDTPTVRRTVKQNKDSNTDKDPVHVNVTVVVKKFASSSKEELGQTTAEAFVEPKLQPYFEPVQHPTEPTQEKTEEINQRPRSIDHQQLKSSDDNFLEQIDRHVQSDTEQIVTEEQKKRRRPKRISRTSQTYECVFRRMEREQTQDLRTTSDTEKNIQTKKSQLRPRKKSPKRNQSVYLSADSFHLEELLPKQFHQSRRNMSKSSSLARSLSPHGGKLLILRPTLPFHHTDAVNVQRVCLQYAIDLIPNENFQGAAASAPPQRNRLSILKQPEQTNNLPMISASSSGVNMSTNKSNIKEKSASYKSEDYTHQRKTGGAV